MTEPITVDDALQLMRTLTVADLRKALEAFEKTTPLPFQMFAAQLQKVKK